MIKLKPACKDYIWGGNRLIKEFGKETDKPLIAETWELSCHPDGMSMVDSGEHKGKPFIEYIEINGRQILGENCLQFSDFPILIKLIDAKSDLSIQVHPNDEYSLKNENSFGKTEMWYVIDREPGARLYYGFKESITKDQFARAITEGNLTQCLNAVEVNPGDVFFIEAGTIHAIGAGILIAEIQQNSNITYRVFDYNRKGPDGKLRELHIDKAAEVTSLNAISSGYDFSPHIASCKYFTVDKITAGDNNGDAFINCVDQSSFHHLLITQGEAVVYCKDESIEVKKGDSVFLPANSGSYECKGNFTALLTYIPAQVNPA